MCFIRLVPVDNVPKWQVLGLFPPFGNDSHQFKLEIQRKKISIFRDSPSTKFHPMVGMWRGAEKLKLNTDQQAWK